MNDDDDISNWKDLVNIPPPDAWARVIAAIKASKVCFYPGRNGQAPEFEDFVGALHLIGDCGALVYAEPRLTRGELWDQVDWHRRNLQIPIPGVGFVHEIDMMNPDNWSYLNCEGLFGHPVTEWVPPELKPDDSRLWGEYCRLTISDRTVHLLHIGIAGDAAWAYFFQPHGIQAARIISNPQYQ